MSKSAPKRTTREEKLHPRPASSTFNLLSIGQRGVGKTVFLAGSYAQSHLQHSSERPQMWLDCQDNRAKENLEGLLGYVAQTGQYPPLTIKATDFNFSLKHDEPGQAQTLCYFRWWDIPGEICDAHNPEFAQMVTNSHGCCVFIDAYALIHQPDYKQVLEDVIMQVAAIAFLVRLNKIDYAFAIVLTKCDLIESSPAWQQQLEEKLKPLTSRLKSAKANYKVFTSAIAIAKVAGIPTLQAKDSAAPLFWLVQEISGIRPPGENRLLSRSPRPQPNFSRPALADALAKRSKTAGSSSRGKWYWSAAIVLIVALVGILGYSLFQRRAGNLNSKEEIESAQRLAVTYVASGQLDRAEALYDEILAQEKNNLEALISKAVLRRNQGDMEAARSLLKQAEEAAPPEQKPKIQELAQSILEDSD